MLPRFAICLPYHNAPTMLRHHYAHWGLIAPHMYDFQSVIVDDCSNAPMPHPLGIPHEPASRIEGWRILGDHVPWSHRCATNWAVEKSMAPWLLITDMDHVVPLSTVVQLQDMFTRLDPNNVYTFERRNTDGSEKKSHPDSWLMSRSMWKKIGGYDERYRGHYGQNHAFTARVDKHAAFVVRLSAHLVRYDRADITDASMPADYPRKSLAGRAAVSALRHQFAADGTFYDRHALTTFVKRVF